MQAVKVGDGRVGQVVRVEHGEEAHHNGRNCQDVEHRVEKLFVDLTAASVRAVRKESIAGEIDETADHEHRVVIELELGLVAPTETASIVDHPKQDEAERAVQQQLGKTQQPAEDEPIGLAGRGRSGTRCRVHLG